MGLNCTNPGGCRFPREGMCLASCSFTHTVVPTPECECGKLLAAGAFGGWWCPVHKDVTPVPYAVEAVKLCNERTHGVMASHVSLPRELVSRAIEHLQTQATYTPSERNKAVLLAVSGELLAHVSGVGGNDGR